MSKEIKKEDIPCPVVSRINKTEILWAVCSVVDRGGKIRVHHAVIGRGGTIRVHRSKGKSFLMQDLEHLNQYYEKYEPPKATEPQDFETWEKYSMLVCNPECCTGDIVMVGGDYYKVEGCEA